MLKLISGLFLSLGLVFASANAAEEKKPACCTKKLACCAKDKACCGASTKLGCCAKGMACCTKDKGCCSSVQECCKQAAKCCDEAKACCGTTAKRVEAKGCCGKGMLCQSPVNLESRPDEQGLLPMPGREALLLFDLPWLARDSHDRHDTQHDQGNQKDGAHSMISHPQRIIPPSSGPSWGTTPFLW